ncbi:MAG: cupin-like domain-containing protein, partial [Chlorobia bacterium]|nr:cupin-like domain-containing protein [Fimbriimonadaceae bacterium]
FELGAPVKAEAFFTPPGAQAFAEHYDTNDSFICQIEGTKAWRLYYPSFRDPLPRHPWSWADVSDEIAKRITKQPPDLEIVLEPGQVLWIPRGWIHAGTAASSASLHLTLRPEPASLDWVLRQLLEGLSDGHPDLRRSIRFRSLITTASAATTIAEAIDFLTPLLSRTDLDAASVDLWRSYGALFAGPILRPIADTVINEKIDISTLWVRPEGAVGYRRKGNELHIHLGTARKVLIDVQASLLEGLLAVGDYVRVKSLVEKFSQITDWETLVPALKAVGLVVRGTELPNHWLMRFE